MTRKADGTAAAGASPAAGEIRRALMGCKAQNEKEVIRMKTYKIYLSDHPYEPLTGTFPSVTAARKAARLYIKQWKLDAKIINVEVCD